PGQAFAVSMLTSLSIASVLSDWLQMDVLIKWPNDMYVGDRKLCGILIENAFTASGIEHAIIGVGINVNQQRFLSDAPNPVSMYQLTGRSYDLDALLGDLTRRILVDYEQYAASPDIEALTARYRAHQWRGTGIHRWHDHLRHEDIAAAIAAIAPDGTLTLATTPPRSFAFKQLSPIL
ncbi:MAG: biotin--[acetyl-CoA-carboxylase] ligase, partial [Muribaculaceae bacterium]